jgi:hypothetical protein
MLPEEESLDELARRAGQGDKEALEGICRQTAPSAYRSKARSQRARLSVPHGSWIWPRQSRSCIGPIPASLRRRGFGKRSGKLPQISSDPSDGGRASPVDRCSRGYLKPAAPGTGTRTPRTRSWRRSESCSFVGSCQNRRTYWTAMFGCIPLSGPRLRDAGRKAIASFQRAPLSRSSADIQAST